MRAKDWPGPTNKAWGPFLAACGLAKVEPRAPLLALCRLYTNCLIIQVNNIPPDDSFSGLNGGKARVGWRIYEGGGGSQGVFVFFFFR